MTEQEAIVNLLDEKIKKLISIHEELKNDHNRLKAEKTELTAEELKGLQEEKKRLQEEVEKRHADELKKATDIVESLKGKEKSVIKAKLHEAGVPEDLIKKLLPSDVGAQAGEAKGKGGKK